MKRFIKEFFGRSKELSIISELRKNYDSPVVKSLILLLSAEINPILVTGHQVLAWILEDLYKKRLRVFFDELSKGDVVLSQELIQKEDFLHCFFATAKGAMIKRCVNR